MTRRLKILLTGSVIGIGTYVAAYFIVPTTYVPPEFSEARISSAETAKKIVELSAGSLANLEAIAKYDAQGNRQAALALVSQELTHAQEMHRQAITLASRLDAMSRSISDIKPSRAQVLATEAVSSEVSLVSHLLFYNAYLEELFQVLRYKFEHGGSADEGQVRLLIDEVNKEAQAVNDFNRRSNQSLAEFDKVF